MCAFFFPKEREEEWVSERHCQAEPQLGVGDPRRVPKPSRLQAGARELGEQKTTMQEDWPLRKRGLMMKSCLTPSRPGF